MRDQDLDHILAGSPKLENLTFCLSSSTSGGLGDTVRGGIGSSAHGISQRRGRRWREQHENGVENGFCVEPALGPLDAVWMIEMRGMSPLDMPTACH